MIPTPPRKYKVTLYSPHDAQLPLHKSKARFRCACCGRRFGKTMFAANEESKFALDHNTTLCWWVAPTYRQSEIAYRMMKGALRDIIAKPNDTDLRLELLNTSVIQCFSCDKPDNLRGEGVHFMVVEEAAMIPGDTWYKVLRPMLSDTNGRAIFISTPRGRNWFYNMYQRGIDLLQTDYESFTFPTSANPYIPPQEIEDARRDLPEDVFRQEYLAEFLEESAGVFRGVDACIAGEFVDPNPSHAYVLGWDPAKYQDFSVITVLNCSTMHVDYWERTNHVEYTTQLSRLYEIAERYHATVLMDMTGVGDPLLEQMHQQGIHAEGYLFTNASKKALIETLVVAIQQRAVTFPNIPVLVSELRTMEYQLTPSRLIQYSAPQGAHDDAVISLALAYHAGATPYMPLSDGRAMPLPVQPASSDGLIPFTEPIHPAYRDGYVPTPVIAPAQEVDPFSWVAKRWGDDW